MRKLRIIGLVIIIISLCVLWWNEGKYINVDKIVGDIDYTVVDSETISASNDNLTIFTSGPVNKQELYDNQFDIEVESQILIRKVEIYQWVEKTDNDGKVSYKKQWTDGYIDSTAFKEEKGHQNKDTNIENKTMLASNVRLGSYKLSEEQLSRIEPNTTYSELSENVAKDYKLIINGNYYTNVQEGKPEVGNIRISFLYSTYTNMSILAIQSGDTLNDYITSSNKNISTLYPGKLTVNQVLNSLSGSKYYVLLAIRIIVLVLCYIGTSLLLNKIKKNKIVIYIGMTFIEVLLLGACRWYSYYEALSSLLIIIAILIILFEIYLLKKSKK